MCVWERKMWKRREWKECVRTYVRVCESMWIRRGYFSIHNSNCQNQYESPPYLSSFSSSSWWWSSSSVFVHIHHFSTIIIAISFVYQSRGPFTLNQPSKTNKNEGSEMAVPCFVPIETVSISLSSRNIVIGSLFLFPIINIDLAHTSSTIDIDHCWYLYETRCWFFCYFKLKWINSGLLKRENLRKHQDS